MFRNAKLCELGKLPALDEKVHAGWDRLNDLLEGRSPINHLELTKPNQPAGPLRTRTLVA